MDFLPVLLMSVNCCLMPLAFMGLGYAWGRGYLRSPIAINNQENFNDAIETMYKEEN